MKLTQEQGIYLRKQIAKQQEDRKNGIVETFPLLTEAQKKALKVT